MLASPFDLAGGSQLESLLLNVPITKLMKEDLSDLFGEGEGEGYQGEKASRSIDLIVEKLPSYNK